MKLPFLVLGFLLTLTANAAAQQESACRILCAPELKIEPTVTFTNLFGSPRITSGEGPPARAGRATELELIFSIDVPTRLSWLGLTIEAIVAPVDRDSTPELEFESNFTWLPAERTGGWLSSHFDLVEKFSPAERPDEPRAYTHKLNLELDTSLALFGWLSKERWLRGVELEGSLDYVATGLPRAGDRLDDVLFVDKASPWSFSIVFVLPVAP